MIFFAQENLTSISLVILCVITVSSQGWMDGHLIFPSFTAKHQTSMAKYLGSKLMPSLITFLTWLLRGQGQWVSGSRPCRLTITAGGAQAARVQAIGRVCECPLATLHTGSWGVGGHTGLAHIFTCVRERQWSDQLQVPPAVRAVLPLLPQGALPPNKSIEILVSQFKLKIIPGWLHVHRHD